MHINTSLYIRLRQAQSPNIGHRDITITNYFQDNVFVRMWANISSLLILFILMLNSLMRCVKHFCRMLTFSYVKMYYKSINLPVHAYVVVFAKQLSLITSHPPHPKTASDKPQPWGIVHKLCSLLRRNEMPQKSAVCS